MPGLVGQSVNLQLAYERRSTWNVEPHAARHSQPYMFFDERLRLTMEKAFLEQKREVSSKAHHMVIRGPRLMDFPQAS